MQDYKIIRDVVHLDIVIEKKYFCIIDTMEFQRLSRVKQLSCEYMVFPTATHTRLSHSLGTFYVMQNLIDHVSVLLSQLGYNVDEEDKELALCAALVHDIGHGPFSHTFEKIFDNKTHEMWTVDILSSPDTQIHHAIIKEFGEKFLLRLIDIISKNYKSEPRNEIFSIISMLMSSQVDADRMDYLLRDSYFTSVTNGNYDFKRLIRSLGVQLTEDGMKLFIDQKFLATLEEYILARYYMHKEVYQHPIKRQMEGILKKIFQRVQELKKSGRAIFCDDTLCSLLEERQIDVKEYLRLDDTSFVYHISIWQDHEDPVLSFLCCSFLQRNKFKTFNIHTDYLSDKESIRGKNKMIFGEDKIKEIINSNLKANNIDEIDDFSKEYFYFEDDMDLKIYVNTDENIWIKRQDNTLSDLTQVSVIINKANISDRSECIRRIYLSSQLFRIIYGIDLDL